ncbi:S8 family serine peptidase [Streptomyces sp. NPDC051940]|uniref:S8 family serine peptidase n=1 Tax=Streptomyces sp. NPDC051940 TaxID=3155675 RepID=UPI0034344A86
MRRTGLRTRRWQTAAAVAAAGVWGASFIGLAPVASAQDARSQQWYLDAMQADKMWEASTGEGVTVAVIDTGVGDTPALQGRVVAGKDITKLAGDARTDYDGHGTTMAELIAGSGKNGKIQGLAPGAKILPVRVELGEAAEEWVDPQVMAKAIRAAADSDAQIINMSVAGTVYDGFTEDAVKYAVSKGKLVFAGTGNDGDGANKTAYPAGLTEVVGVGAVDKTGEHAKFSGYGKSVDLAAPGTETPYYCDKSLSRYCSEQGTSGATALASASAALVWAEHPDWTANQVLRVLIDTAGRSDDKKVRSEYIGWGAVRPRLNLLEGQGDPGAPGQNPLAPASDQSAAPSEQADEPAADDEKATATEAAGAEASDDDGNGALWTILGVAVLALGAVGGGVYAMTRRRTT